MTKYEKPFKSINEQISFLRDRGLVIQDEILAKRFLGNISYYHLAVYMKPFQNHDDSFKDNINFEDIINLYVFDKKLRFLLLDMLERIEVSLKNTLIYEISKKTDNIFWYTDIKNFEVISEDQKTLFDDFLEKTKNSKEDYIQHYYQKYSQPEYPPSWMFFESLSFGQSCKLLGILKTKNQNAVAGKYKLPPTSNLKWLRSLSFLRNVCAHHSRLWNRQFTYNISGAKTSYQNHLQNINNKSLFAYLIILNIYLQQFNPTSTWKDRLEKLIIEHKINITKMGFPDDWKSRLDSLPSNNSPFKKHLDTDKEGS